MLSSLPNILQLPGLGGQDQNWLNTMLGAADQAIKTYCKRDLEQTDYTEFYSGNVQRDLVLRQYPVALSGLSVYLDPSGYYGQSPGGFASGTLLTLGTDYVLVLDSGGTVSNRGCIKRIGGVGGAFIGFYPDNWQYSGKLAASQGPVWPLGDGNIKVIYTAGYATVPMDLTHACNMLVAWMVRNLPMGAPLNSESLGAYSYSSAAYAALGSVPELGAIARSLAPYREISFGNQ